MNRQAQPLRASLPYTATLPLNVPTKAQAPSECRGKRKKSQYYASNNKKTVILVPAER